MSRKLFLGWPILLALAPAWVLALEIGEIQVNSSLNQLFDARIPLPGLKPEEVDKVSIKLASKPIFKEFNLERTALLTKLVFSIEYNPEGEVYVKVISTQPVREPSLGLLVEFGWPRGKTYREFTVLLDPIKRLAKQSGDRTKTVLDGAPAAVSPPIAVSDASKAAASVPAPPPPAVAKTASSPKASEPSEPAALPDSVASAPAPTPSGVAPTPPATPEPVPDSKPTPAPVAGDSTPSPASAIAVAPTPAPTSPPAIPVPVSEPTAPAAVAENAQISSATPKPALAAEAGPSSSQLQQYKAGGQYGPVKAGERLWKIAQKVSPDPSISPDQMVKALHKANPKAFSKAGMDGLIAGSLLRVPSLREIADFTGSAAARQLADAKPVEPASGDTPPASADRIEMLQVEPDGLKTYPLPLPPSLEPMPVEGAALAAGLTPFPYVAEPSSATSPMLGPTGGENVKWLAVVDTAEVAKKQKAPSSEAVIEFEKRPKTSPPAARGSLNAIQAAPYPLLEPISATPLLFSATSQVMASALKIPAFALPIQIAPASIIAGERSSDKTGNDDANGSLISPVTSDRQKALAFKAAKAGESVAVAATSATKVKVSADRPDSPKQEQHYGPVTANERLWDIAAQVRPHPNIGKDVMMSALFKANPQAFARGSMDQMKEGATLRIPGLEEIVKHTGSKEAKQLLEQQRAGENQTAERSAPLSAN